MAFHTSARQLTRTAHSRWISSQPVAMSDVYEPFSRLCLCQKRSFHTSKRQSNPNEQQSISEYRKLQEQIATPAQKLEALAKRSKAQIKAQNEKDVSGQQRLGSLAPNNLFAETEDADAELEKEEHEKTKDLKGKEDKDNAFASRNFSHMDIVLNPRPTARARWQRRMVIRHVRHGGRLTKEMKIERLERSHMARSHFFKTSMKKLAPLARQIAGKTLDEAILQMRFSAKKAAKDVRAHLINARAEATVSKGMGLGLPSEQDSSENTKSLSTTQSDETNIYIDQAWTNRGPYGKEPEYRAKGRINMLRPPYTGLTVLLKEEKTRTRVKAEKEEKVIRKRMGKNMWTQLPDRKITRQTQQVLW